MIVEIEAFPWCSTATVTIDGVEHRCPRPVAQLLMESRRRMHEAETLLERIGDDLPIDINEVYGS